MARIAVSSANVATTVVIFMGLAHYSLKYIKGSLNVAIPRM
jgi:hypothetical protein